MMGMRGKKILNFSIISISFTVLILAFVAVAPAMALPTTLVVDDDGMATTTDCGADTVADSTTIQGAVTAASSGDTIIVCEGTYGKVDIPSGKDGLTLKSASNPVIDCAGSTGGTSVGNGITIGSDGVTVQGFEIRFCDNGIQGTSISDTLIKRNEIHDNKNPSIGFQGVGIAFNGDSDRNTVNENKIFDNDRQGIFLGGSCTGLDTDSEHNVISDNDISDNGQDLLATLPDPSQYGIQLCEADNNVIVNNAISGHNEWDFAIGIYLFDSKNNLVAQNELENNRQGVVMFGSFGSGPFEGAMHNVIIKNQIEKGVAPICALPTCSSVGSNFPATGIRIFDSASSDNIIAKNEIKENAGWGVDVVELNTIADNIAEKNGLGGYVIKGSGNTITENDAKDNTGNGFMATSTSSGNNFVANNAEGNTGFGFLDLSAGPANTYNINECDGNTAGGSSPSGLCSPQP